MSQVNGTAPGIIAAACAVIGPRFVHMSTDVVLDGRNAPYTDTAPANPLTDYGRSKAVGERTLLRGAKGALVIRTSLVVDDAEPDRFTRSCMDRLARREPVDLFIDEFRCPITRRSLGVALADVLGREGAGAINIAGAERMSRHALGLLLLTHFGVKDLSLVRGVSAAGHREPRPLDLTLDVSRAQRMLRSPLPRISDDLR
jgi:dTDP-4-dehydrorhamnose reductase